MIHWLISLFTRRKSELWDSLSHYERWELTRGVDLPTSGRRKWKE